MNDTSHNPQLSMTLVSAKYSDNSLGIIKDRVALKQMTQETEIYKQIKYFIDLLGKNPQN
jgi:hypothetical protein